MFFSNVNYYRVKGYLLPFLHDDIISDLDFEKLKAIYYFDMELRNLLSKTIEKIEIEEDRSRFFCSGVDNFERCDLRRDQSSHSDSR